MQPGRKCKILEGAAKCWLGMGIYSPMGPCRKIILQHPQLKNIFAYYKHINSKDLAEV